MGVRDGVSASRTPRDCCRIAGDFTLSDRIFDCLSGVVLSEPCEFRLPAVVGIQVSCSSSLLAICKQLHRDGRRAAAVLVVSVVP